MLVMIAEFMILLHCSHREPDARKVLKEVFQYLNNYTGKSSVSNPCEVSTFPQFFPAVSTLNIYECVQLFVHESNGTD